MYRDLDSNTAATHYFILLIISDFLHLRFRERKTYIYITKFITLTSTCTIFAEFNILLRYFFKYIINNNNQIFFYATVM